jgi:hypothetical protein
METKRSTVYLEPEIHKALKLRSAESDVSISSLINNALKAQLSEDVEDLVSFQERKKEPTISFEAFVKKLKKSGKI